MIFIPKKGEWYSFIKGDGRIGRTTNEEMVYDIHYIKSGNCYRTEEDARKARDRQYAKRELEVLADELNDGVEIDWKDYNQSKYHIYFDYISKNFNQLSIEYIKITSVIYSLSPNFLEEALKRLGEEKLKLILEVE